MGIYISKPVTDKECSDEESSFLKCGSSSMQGWRTSQEDAHNAILDFDKNGSLFAVYDGHGGHEVAEYTALHFPTHLLANEFYKNGNMRKALVEAFLTFDRHLLTPEVLSLLKKMASSKKGEEADESTDSEDPDIVSALRKDANMPIDDLLASRYAGKALAKLKEVGSSESAGVSSDLHQKRSDSEEETSNDAPTTPEKPDDKNVDRCSSGSSISSSDCISSSKNKSDDSLGKFNEEGLPPKEELECNSDKSKEESPNFKAQELTNGDTEEISSDSGAEIKKLTNGDVADHEAEEAVNGDADKDKSDLVVEGRRIVPTMLSAHVSSKTPESPGYTGKGKSGGKGGKVKGKSAITTTTLSTEESTHTATEAPVTRATDSKARRAALDEVKRKVLSQEDLDSDDEDEDDENYAVDGNLAHKLENDLAGDDNDVDDDDDDDDDSDDDEDDDDDDEDENSDDEDESSDNSQSGEEVGAANLGCGNEDEEDDENGLATEDDDIYSEFYAKMPDGPGYDSGCTACVALLHQNKLYVANVGDSRCVLSRAGKAVDMSVDHKPEDDVETERIIKAGGKVTEDGRVNGGLNLSRALGDHGYKMNTKVPATEQMISPLPDLLVKTITKEDDFIIIACDGIWNSLSSQEAVDFVKERLDKDPDTPLSSVCNEMFEHCLAPDLGGDGTGCDNMTCIIVSFKEKSSFAEPGIQDDEEEDLEDTKLASSSTDNEKSGVNGVAFEDMNGDSTEKEPVTDSRKGNDLDDGAETMDDDSRDQSEVVSHKEVKNGKAEAKDVNATKRSSEPCAVEDDRPCKKLKVDTVEETSPVSV
ncbi:PPM-type phosphatase domain [Trinorchestia longiramus]|nr:PPM-type phosphatase domain [Trinorchestia longiramus]